jgi:hypothetical protein
MARTIAIATLVAGTLDILFAMILTLAYGGEIPNMLRFVGSGPIPTATEMGAAGAALGLLTHFTLIAIMAAAFAIAAKAQPSLLAKPLIWGTLYGLATYAVMNWIVVPLRFDSPFPTKPLSIATQLFAHIVLVGIPIAVIAARQLKSRAFA